MMDSRIQKLAEVLVNYSVSVRPGDRVLIRAGTVAVPMMKALLAAVLEAGGHPFAIPAVSGAQELVYRHASDEQLQHIPEPLKLAYETYDAMISVSSSINTKALTGVPPEKIRVTNRAQSDLFKTFLERAAAGELRWVGCLYPTTAYAQDAEMSLVEYEEFVFGACLPELDDPIGSWNRFSAWQQRIVDWLEGKETLRVDAPDVDLRMRIAGRTFENCDGKKNMPDGEIFTGPIEESIEGSVRFSYPTVYFGRKLEGVRLRFEKGKVVEAAAEKGEAFLLETLETDEGARYVGEFAIGTNERITRATGNTLFDEKINGSFHMALGAGMPETGSRNRSSIHWDMVCDLSDGGRIWVDDELFYENGQFAISL